MSSLGFPHRNEMRRAIGFAGIGVLPAIGVAMIAMTGALMLGLASAFLPWWIVVPFLVAALFIVGVMLIPELGVAITIAAFFGLFPDLLLPRLPFFGGRFAAEDLGVITLLMLLVVRHLGSVKARLSIFRAYAPLFLLLIVLISVSAYVSMATQAALRKDVLSEVRPFFAWLILPVCALALDTPVRLRRFLWLLLAIALLLSCGVIFQSITGIQVLSKGQFMELGTLGERYGDFLRSTTPGMFLIAASLIFLIASHSIKGLRWPWLGLFAGAILFGGVLVGFGRGVWVSVFIGILIVGLLTWSARFVKIVIIISTSISIGTAAALIFKPEAIEAVGGRLLSIGSEIQFGESYGRRKIENEYAWKQILKSPFMGVGLGAAYKPPSEQSIAWAGETRYIHNTYVNVATKMGVPAFFIFAAFVFLMLTRAWTAIRIAATADKAIAIASFWAILSSAVITSLTQPNLISPSGVASLAVALFLVETVRLRARPMSRPLRRGAPFVADS